MRSDFFRRLPPPTALLLLAAILDGAHAFALPRPTTTLPHRVLDVVSWPLRPTPPPISLEEFHDLRIRGSEQVCGYIGGDPSLPATCQVGSHCVLDAQHGAVGCCPNGQESCTTGVFTGCVDFNSGAQTEANPYVFTCQGSDVCYKNEFAGGYSQFGCGTASDLATTVAAVASGLTSDVSLAIPSLSVSFTASPSTLAEPTTIDPSTGTRSFTRTTSNTDTTSTSTDTSTTDSTTSSSTTSSTSTSTSTTSSTTSTSTTSSSTTSTSTTSSTTAGSAASSGSQVVPPPASGSGPTIDRTGAIIGGTISGVAVLVALVAIGFYLWKRHRGGNTRTGPGNGGTAYISPMTGPEFQAIPGGGGPGGPGPPPAPPMQAAYGYAAPNAPGPYAPMAGAAAAGAAAGVAGGYGAYRGIQPAGQLEADQIPLTREVDDFSRSFNDALPQISEEDGSDLADYYRNTGTSMSGAMAANGLGTNTASGSHYTSEQPPTTAGEGTQGSADRPLWQQNRRQSRNLMWM